MGYLIYGTFTVGKVGKERNALIFVQLPKNKTKKKKTPAHLPFLHTPFIPAYEKMRRRYPFYKFTCEHNVYLHFFYF